MCRPQGTGIFILAGTLELESTLIAANTADAGAGPEPDDVGANGSSELTGANNLIFSTSTTVPADTLVGIDPLLLPLADNGGPTTTLALSANSPAIDAGNNAGGFAFDQRGFARTVGAETDIGAVEFGASNTIFADGFEAVADRPSQLAN